VLAIILAQTSEIIPGEKSEQFRKTLIWEQGQYTICKYSGSGYRNFLENYSLGIGTQNEFSEIPGEPRPIAKDVCSPQKEIVFRVRKSLITDIHAGWEHGKARPNLYQCS
jgi:hypothetical protein